jgi:hypothetical protein
MPRRFTSLSDQLFHLSMLPLRHYPLIVSTCVYQNLILYRLGFHVVDSDNSAAPDFEATQVPRQPGSRVPANQAPEAAIAGTSYDCADHPNQRARNRRTTTLTDRIELGHVMIGTATMMAQANRVGRQLDADVFRSDTRL